MARVEDEFSFLIDGDEDEITITSNDGDGKTCSTLDDIRAYMRQRVEIWCDDLDFDWGPDDDDDDDDDGRWLNG